MHTENEMLMWLVYVSIAAGFVFSFVGAFLMDFGRDSPAFLMGCGLGMGGGGLVTGAFGFLVGLFVAPLYDTDWRPGLGFALANGLMGFIIIGPWPAIVSGALGGALGGWLKQSRG